jgi:hypothetical protein
MPSPRGTNHEQLYLPESWATKGGPAQETYAAAYDSKYGLGAYKVAYGRDRHFIPGGRNDLGEELAHRRRVIAQDRGLLEIPDVEHGQQGYQTERGQWEQSRGRDELDPSTPHARPSMLPASALPEGSVPVPADEAEPPEVDLQNNIESSKRTSWEGSNRPQPTRAPLSGEGANNSPPTDSSDMEEELRSLAEALAARVATRRQQVQGAASMDQAAASPREMWLRSYLSGFPDQLSEDDVDEAVRLYRKEVARDAPAQLTPMTPNTPFTRTAMDRRPSNSSAGSFFERFPECRRLPPMMPSDRVR